MSQLQNEKKNLENCNYTTSIQYNWCLKIKNFYSSWYVQNLIIFFSNEKLKVSLTNMKWLHSVKYKMDMDLVHSLTCHYSIMLPYHTMQCQTVWKCKGETNTV